MKMYYIDKNQTQIKLLLRSKIYSESLILHISSVLSLHS